MTIIKNKVKFPCGLECKEYIEIGFLSAYFGGFAFKQEKIKECPLHGKNCPPNKRNKK